MTSAQNAILRILREPSHLTAEGVYSELKKEIPNVALGTVYRNLSHFTEMNMIRRIRRANAPDLFDGNMAPHDHIICAKCGKSGDVSLPGLKEFVSAGAKVEILSVEVLASYICPECLKKGDGAAQE
jgi:Fe2+ or Zn2+ uptake regulation protein